MAQNKTPVPRFDSLLQKQVNSEEWESIYKWSFPQTEPENANDEGGEGVEVAVDPL